MDWPNERYVRVYTRDTDEWLFLSWEARALWLLLMRKLDRAGVLPVKHGAKSIAALTGVPLDVVTRVLPELIEDGCIAACPIGYVSPNFMDAQEATQTDTHRKRESRSARREKAVAESLGVVVLTASGPVTDGHDSSQAVPKPDNVSEIETSGHETGPNVPPCPERSQLVTPNQTKPDQTNLSPPERASGTASPDPRAELQRSLLSRLFKKQLALFNSIRLEIGSTIPAMQPLGDPAEVSLLELLKSQVTLDGFEDRALHVLAVRAAEARKQRTLKYLGRTVWTPDSFGIAVTMEVGEDRSGPARNQNGRPPEPIRIIPSMAQVEAERRARRAKEEDPS